MINKIIDFSVKNRLIIALLTLVLVAWGGYNFTHLPIDAVPDITNNQVQVVTVSPSLATQEVEQFITFPVELNMQNIQGVTEIRSISRFGLSVVTVVFKDNIDPYLARQMVTEQIKIAENDIPEGYGTPELMPVTTGLGEIYQYVIEPLPGYENVYTPMKIRTIQDWIVKRYLSGIPGIVEVSSFGGYLKQYEVTIKPRTLVGMDLTILEIFKALENNNENSGGSYIERGPEAYYIRAEGLVRSVEDIENIVIKNINGIPILIKDVASVRFGAPQRFGAMTKDGKGEAVGGITLMLKGANTSKVIKDVQQRMEEVKKILPKGLKIHAYLDRSVLIDKTINTVSKNLIEGGLIVIFILVLLLGNLRGGLIVASVIPLSMLFAFSMMRLFNVSANLMSLGAIDFGLIVDGSVIVIEGIIYQINKDFTSKRISQLQLNKSIYKAGTRVSKSAVFGVIIILIVYVPILLFTGIEGKMFKPMAQTVSFALLGALILSLTYVPMMAATFLSRKISIKKTFADKIIEVLQKAHKPVLEFSLRSKTLLLSLVILVVAISFWVFSRMGGEFIPTLEEGDLAAQMTLSPGSSLSESIASSTRAEKVLLEHFPEVKEVVSKIGTAEVPTDPMAIEDADIMIILKPKDEWTSADNREDLVMLMKEKLSVLPGVSFEFQQPIQLRFNELMTGVKADVAVKIYGEKLDVLYDNAVDAAALIQDIEGAGDVKVEQAVGLPQLVINYDRKKIARFGLSIGDINRIIRTAFAGESAGFVFEGERRFDLVVRLCEECRNNIQAIENLRISPPNEELIVLRQVADIGIKSGPMQISRDDTKRRITIGINVRNRDVESFVTEISNVLEKNLELPAGYYITYGGQFENLQAAKRSSSIAVPVALAIILVLLYFAFNSLKQSLMIFTAIPLAAVGGIWALYFRGMPFSISAGVGFIALFGVAVLNGIVLLSYYNQLEKEGVADLFERVRRGTKMRLRPVVMTASVAALGFIPMALSNAPGAEVQKPLATVVIGGLITATFLTLVVLPVIYVLFSSNGRKNRKPKAALSLLFLFFTIPVFSQQQAEKQEITLDLAIQTALAKNLQIKNSKTALEIAEVKKHNTFRLDDPELMYEYGQINSSLKDEHLSVLQNFNFPTKYFLDAKIASKNMELAEKELIAEKVNLTYKVKSVYYSWLTLLGKQKLYKQEWELIKKLKEGREVSFQSGESDYMTRLMAENSMFEAELQLKDIQNEINSTERRLKNLLNINYNIFPKERSIKLIHADTTIADIIIRNNVIIQSYLLSEEISRVEKQRLKHNYFPDFSLGYFRQSIDNTAGYEGWIAGIKIPLWFWKQSADIKVSGLKTLQLQNKIKAEMQFMKNEFANLKSQLSLTAELLFGINQNNGNNAQKLIEVAQTNFDSGNINYFEYVWALREAIKIQIRQLELINEYNQIVLKMNQINGNY